MLLNRRKEELFLESLIRKSNLLTKKEFEFLLENECNVTYSKKYYEEFTTAYNRWINHSNDLNPTVFNNQIEHLVFEESSNNYELKLKLKLKDYLALNILCKIIPYNEILLNEFILKGINNKMQFIIPFYRSLQKDFLPKWDSIKMKSNRKLACILFLKTEYGNQFISEEKILDLLFMLVKNSGDNYTKAVIEFSMEFYPLLEKYNYFGSYENIIDYINRYKRNFTIDPELELKEHFEKTLSEFSEFEFYSVAKSYINDRWAKKTLNYNALKRSISIYNSFFKLCVENHQVPITHFKEFTGFHRDLFIEHIKNLSRKEYLAAVSNLIRHYNSFFVTDGKFIDPSFFSLPKKIKIADKTALKETGIGAFASSIYFEVIFSRKNSLETKSQYELYQYIKIRLLWLILLTGGRYKELNKLKLIEVQDAINFKSPYIFLQTVKGGNNRTIEFDRGELRNDVYEYDWLSLDIILELIEAAKYIYKDLPIKPEQKYLFPSFRTITNPCGYQSINKLSKKIQIENKIVYGSVYDILNREAYIYNNRIRGRLDKPLFNIHDFRHFSVEIFRKYARLTQVEIQKFTGHRNRKSEEYYGEHFMIAVDTFKVMEKYGHTYGENKLVVNQPGYINPNVQDKSNLAFIQDIDNYFNNTDYFSSRNLSAATKVIDEDTDCQTLVACAETGIGCTSCEYFRAGEETIEKKDAIKYLLEYEYNQIELLIIELMESKKELLKKNRGSKVLLVNKFIDICIRFEKINQTKNLTLMSVKQGFGWSESTANRFLSPIYKNIRKNDLDKEVVSRIKEIVKEGLFEEEVNISLYRDSKNRVVFKNG
ncbi:hypothetical protein ACOMCU_24705 [Lysinibacillus sp. UGB7]|uniref:hypothetical protein n=1 Tax=Lysinibacillus sp. UGB7 TaxID=3411039 RepID=UPI003B7C4A70